jgi:hypothetical protein
MPDDYKYCTNCGQNVTGQKALAAANPAKKFCCQCGIELDSAGKCQNPDDTENYGKVPQC